MNTAIIPARELPICRRARQRYTHLWDIFDAASFCRALCQLAAVPTITAEEYAAIAKVAEGEMWPVPDHPYTREQWEQDENFSAVAGQEIDEEIYDQMLNVLPPLNLPHCERTKGYSAGFMVGEQDCSDHTGRGYYSAFGKRDGKYYYIGLLPYSRPARTDRW